MNVVFYILVHLVSNGFGVRPSPPFCPFTQAAEAGCEYEELRQSGGKAFTVGTFFPKSFEGITPCQVWKWAQLVQNNQYPPLREYVGHLKKLIRVKVDLNVLQESFGMPPEPPQLKKLMESAWENTCEPLNSVSHRMITSRLKTANFRSLDPVLVDLLIRHCLIFEVDTTPWKRLVGSVVSVYVMPLGEYSLVIFGHSQRHVAPEGVFQEVYYTIAGSCGVQESPKNCTDRLLPSDLAHAEIGLTRPLERFSVGLLFSENLESFFSIDSKSTLFETKVNIKPNGEWSAEYRGGGGGWEEAQLTLDEGGNFVFMTQEKVCDGGKPGFRTLAIRPVSQAQSISNLMDKIGVWKESDFYSPSFSSDHGIEKGCKAKLGYSEWVARITNQFKFWNADRPSAEEIYQALLNVRFQSRVQGGRITRVKDKVVVGGLREVSEEVPIPLYTEVETQAIRYIEAADQNSANKSTLVLEKKIDDQLIGELWYYRKPVSVWFDERKDKKVRVLFHYPKDWKTPYQTLFMNEINTALFTCEEINKKKERLLRAIYVLFNISPVQQGDEALGKIYLFTLYERIFSQSISNPKAFNDVNWDALIQSPEDFVAKYLPKI